MWTPIRACFSLPSPLFLISRAQGGCQGSGKRAPTRLFWNCPLESYGGLTAIPEDWFASVPVSRRVGRLQGCHGLSQAPEKRKDVLGSLGPCDEEARRTPRCSCRQGESTGAQALVLPVVTSPGTL